MSKETISTRIMTFLQQLTVKRKKRYQLKKQKRLKNTTPSIICNNCICGLIYSDLNLPFYSPTIDVLILSDDYFRFVNHLEHYITCVPEQIFLEGISYPVGVLRYADEQVILRFMHDASFEAAKEKWVRRSARVDLNNLYIVYCNPGVRLRRKSHLYQEFKKIKYPNKRMIVKLRLFFDYEVIMCPRFALYSKGRNIMSYPTTLSKKRFMDDFDYVSFLNK